MLYVLRPYLRAQVDEGGSKRFFQNMWTSFLKARLVCGFPEESLYFNRLQDTYVVHAGDWHDTRIYALFTSSWLDTFPSMSHQQPSMYKCDTLTQQRAEFNLKAQRFPMHLPPADKTCVALMFNDLPAAMQSCLNINKPQGQ